MKTWLWVVLVWLLILGLWIYKSYRVGKLREEGMRARARKSIDEQYQKSAPPPGGVS